MVAVVRRRVFLQIIGEARCQIVSLSALVGVLQLDIFRAVLHFENKVEEGSLRKGEFFVDVPEEHDSSSVLYFPVGGFEVGLLDSLRRLSVEFGLQDEALHVECHSCIELLQVLDAGGNPIVQSFDSVSENLLCGIFHEVLDILLRSPLSLSHLLELNGEVVLSVPVEVGDVEGDSVVFHSLDFGEVDEPDVDGVLVGVVCELHCREVDEAPDVVFGREIEGLVPDVLFLDQLVVDSSEGLTVGHVVEEVLFFGVVFQVLDLYSVFPGHQ